MSIDYKSAGVDVEKGEALVDWLQESESPQPHADKILAGIGGFASIFQMKFPDIEDPCLVSATDGVGTKLKLAIELGEYGGLGQDLVAMCANDLICTGAQPLFFLDYFATSQLDLAQTKPFLQGLRKACVDVGMALIGGETAEMPGLYHGKDFDCAGFAVGVVDRSKILDPKNVQDGSRIMGLASSGFHSNGYSLVRKLFAEDAGDYGDALLEPTTLYVKPVLSGLEKYSGLLGLAHITGGGIRNILRVMPEGLGIELKAWEWTDLYKEAQKRSGLSTQKMLETFNCGVGMAVLVAPDAWQQWWDHFQTMEMKPVDLGQVVPRPADDAIVWPEVWR